jgi:hypothetical protein
VTSFGRPHSELVACDSVGTDLADQKQVVVVCDHDWPVLAPRTSPVEQTSTMARERFQGFAIRSLSLTSDYVALVV